MWMRKSFHGKFRCWWLFLIPLFEGNAFGKLTLQEAFTQAVSNQIELKVIEDRLRAVYTESKAVDAAFDSWLGSSVYKASDKSENLQFRKESLDALGFDLSWRKQFQTGTQARVSFQVEKLEIDFGSSNPTLKEFDKYQPYLKMRLQQPFMRNWLAMEVHLQKKLAEGQVISPKYQALIREQVLKNGVESLYLKYSYLENSYALLVEKEKRGKQLVELVKKRIRYGRSDSMDVALSENQLIAIQGEKLANELEQNSVLVRLRAFIYGADTRPLSEIELLDLNKDILKASTLDEFGKLAMSQRLDMKEVSKTIALLEAKRLLIEEQHKPSLDGFVEYGANRYDKELGTSLSDTLAGKKSKWTVGVSFSMPLGDTRYSAKKEALGFEDNSLRLREKSIAQEVYREAEQILGHISNHEKMFLHDKHLVSAIQKKLEVQDRKYQQARSDRIVSINYEIETLDAKRKMLASQFKQRLEQSKLRLLCHDY